MTDTPLNSRRSRLAPEPQFVPMEPQPETIAKPLPPPAPEPVAAQMEPARETPPARVEPVIATPPRAQSEPALPPPRTRVVVTDIHIEFWSLVVLMVKAAFAAIPALFIVIFLWMLIFKVLSDLFKMHP